MTGSGVNPGRGFSTRAVVSVIGSMDCSARPKQRARGDVPLPCKVSGRGTSGTRRGRAACGESHSRGGVPLFTPSLSTLRRRATAQGYRIWKVRDGSDLFWEYGPYTLSIRATYAVELRGVCLDELALFLDRTAECQEAG